MGLSRRRECPEAGRQRETDSAIGCGGEPIAALNDHPPGRGRGKRVRAFKQCVVETARRVPWWALSALVHALVLLLLAWLKAPVPPRIEVFEAIQVELKEPEPEPLPLDITSQVSPEPPAIDPVIEPPEFREIVDREALSEHDKRDRTRVAAVQGPYGSRNASGRSAALGGGGATEASENAVELGLAWLARTQLSTGAWGRGSGPSRWSDPGVTALGTLAFLGAGYTHRSGKYKRTVARALGYLRQQQDTEGCIALSSGGKRLRAGYMYCHGIGTLALVECYGMTGDPALREPASRAVDFICLTQNSTGGWRYYADSPDGDTSVSGWMVMAMRAASLSGLVVPASAFDRARKFFASVTNKEKGWTAYMPGLQPSSAALIAVGLLCNQYLGVKGNDPYIARAEALINQFPPQWVELQDRMAIENLPATKPGANDYYNWYYANLALHQRRSEAWEKWHPQVRDMLTKVQERKGKDEGSWPPKSRWSLRGGRPYATAMAILALEVYYRYAPLYRNVVDEVLAAYGDALAAYNDFARLHAEKKSGAEEARQAALGRLGRFLELSEPKAGEPTPRPTIERRSQAARMLVKLRRVADELEQTIDLLASFPHRFPAALTKAEVAWQLADAYRARARQLGDAGKENDARAAEALALQIYLPVVLRAPGKNPELELWVAEALFDREQWRKAIDFYKALLQGIDYRKVDAKTPEGQRIVAIHSRLIECCENLGFYRSASAWLERFETMLGSSLVTQRRRAELYRKQKKHAAARRIYEDILKRVPQFGKEWWDTLYDQLFMAYLDGRRAYVSKVIQRLQVTHPDLGGKERKPRFQRLLSMAQKG